MKTYRVIVLASLALALLNACQPGSLWGSSPDSQATDAASTSIPVALPGETSIPTIENPIETAPSLWVDPAIPQFLRDKALGWGLSLAKDSQSATVKLSLENSSAPKIQWIYALVAPFPTLTDDMSYAELKAAWSGASSTGPFAGLPLWMDESTRAAFSSIWGEPAEGAVKTAPADELLDIAWNNMPSWAIIPFEDIQPRWKVLSIDGQSPIHKAFEVKQYPLVVGFDYSSSQKDFAFDLPSTNRDPSKLTTLILTGVTAMARATAATMDAKGVLYPGQDIRDLMREADITHINNEVPFYAGCPTPVASPKINKLVFCSNPRYMDLLLDMGVDVVELSGDHFADYGEEGMLETLKIYDDNHIPYYGGGYNEAKGKAPLLMTVNGNKLMFIACNIKSIYAKASDTFPGAVKCDFPYMTEQIRKYRAMGYLPISTYQYDEFDSPEARPKQLLDYRILAEAGAVIVSGSQAHVPQVMEFYPDGGTFIHYGLGNLFFDQMRRNGGAKITRREFIDRHVFYDGKYLGVELFTTYLEDFSRPRFMTQEERDAFLTEYFKASGWIK